MSDPADHHDRFDALWRDHYAAVVAYGLRRVPDHARDLAADVFLIAWRRIDDVPSDALPWLLAVARNRVANHRRGVRRWLAALTRLAGEPAAFAPDPADGVGAPRLKEALGRLSARDREFIALSAWEGMTPAQAGVVLGVSADAAAVRLHRARRRLGDALTAIDADDAAPRPTTEPKESPP